MEKYINLDMKKNMDVFGDLGGGCGFKDQVNWESYVNHGEWVINVEELPEELKKYALEIDKVFNENVEQGCCGGCL